MSKAFQAPRGTHDVLPRDHLWWRVIRTIEEQCAQYGWSRVSTPGFEDTALFERTSGEASDVVHKEMYTFSDRGDRSITLRPEGTAPIARAYVEHGLAQEPQPVKAYAIAPMYRYGRPGRGRYREHWQLSLEAIGSADPAVDAEVIQFYAELLRRLGVTEWELRLNSIGDENCRPQYVARLNEWLDAQRRLGAVAGMDHRLRRQAVGEHPHGGEERVPVGAGQVDAADGAGEEQVAAEQLAVRMEGDVRRRVTWHGEALEGDPRYLDRLSSAKHVLGRVRASGHAGGRELREALEPLALALRHPDLGTGSLGEVGDPAEMVEVPVGDQDPHTGRIEACKLEA